ncbi:polyprenyl synthetase family protein [Arthrobacter roseus]|uniref:polyprenyl synthetase family protein n=1 Tax=Arthrobacter roseus TaxID=136274 RepID=UPI001966CDB8|nr:polyprenyl synthetase family protein [Arthrobacter roseus]MBM7848321.1 geranylgeranyl diphosphate synthase type I [Arthrobacter roseus]
MDGSRPLTEDITREETSFLQRLSRELDSFLAIRQQTLEEITADAAEPVRAIASLASGGKRMRAKLCYWGFRGAGGSAEDAAIVTAGAGLELFQTAALIHDDVIDNSDTRRGAPSVHRRFANLHQASGWHLDAGRFGEGAAILCGDMALSFSEELFASVAQTSPQARSLFDTMRTEVMAGQYLDIVEEAAGRGSHPGTAVERARNVLRFKSAKYSSEHPLGIGGALAGASMAQLQAYSDFSLPLGEAFQLRDDMLGVFGDPATTGKPAGDDLREGKRTVLIAYAVAGCTAEESTDIATLLGNPDLDETGIEHLRTIVCTSGAREATERLIDELLERSMGALHDLPVEPLVREALSSLGKAAIRRTA